MEDSVGYAGGFDGRADVVGSDDGCAIENCRYRCGQAGRFARVDGRLPTTVQTGKSMAEEGFSGETGEQWAAEREEFALAGKDCIVLVVFFAEAIAGIENDGFRCDAGLPGEGEAFGEAGADKVEQVRGGKFGLCAPLIGAAAGMHQDDAAG